MRTARMVCLAAVVVIPAWFAWAESPSFDGLAIVVERDASEGERRVADLLKSRILEAVDLAEKAGSRPDQLSGGQQQRVAVARALATEPKLILADEPTANLDTANGKQVMETMARLNRETGVTFVFATHDPRVIQYAHRVITLQDGVIVENGVMEGVHA